MIFEGSPLRCLVSWAKDRGEVPRAHGAFSAGHVPRLLTLNPEPYLNPEPVNL